MSEFRANAAKFIEQVRETRKPVIITQHGRSAAVLVDIDSYEGMLDTIGLLQDLLISAEESRQGKTIPFEDVMKEMRALIKR